MKPITASSFHRANECIASEVLEQEDNDSQPAERGRAVAKFLQRVPDVGRADALAEVPEEYREICAAIDLDSRPTHLAAEVSFAYDVVTGEARELGRGLERDYSGVRDTEVCGTADLFGVSEDAVFIGDDKGHQWVPHPDRNLQLRGLAFMAARAHGKERAELAIYRPLSDQRGMTGEMDAFDLEVTEAILVSLWQRKRKALESGVAVPVPGRHCRYCAAVLHCPASPQIVKGLAIVPSFDPAVPVSRGTAAAYLQAEAVVKEWLSANRARLAVMCEQSGPIDLGDGRMFGFRETAGKEKLDPIIGYRVIAEKLGEEVANDASARTITKTAFKESLRKHGVKGRTKLEKEVLQEIRDRGGATRKPSRKLEEYGE